MDNKGFMRISRDKLEGFGWSHNPHVYYVFFRLLFMASYKDKKWGTFDIKRGQIITSRKLLSTEFHLSEQQIRGCLNKLENTGYINLQTTNKYTVITICDYDIWQGEQLASDWQATGSQPTNNQQITNKQPTNNQQTNQQTTNKYTTITLCDYDIWQGEQATKQPTNNQQTTNKQTKNDQQSIQNSTTNKRIKEYKENKLIKERLTIVSQKKTGKSEKYDVRSDLSYVDTNYHDIWVEWLDYKDKIKKQYKTDVGAKKQYSHLVSLSNGDACKAKAIVDQSIMREYEGLFDVKDYKSPQNSIDEMAREAGFPYKDDFGKHYETMFDRNNQRNSYEEYMLKKQV